jgi:hypothetical protein
MIGGGAALVTSLAAVVGRCSISSVSLKILDPQTVAYLDLTASGIETVGCIRARTLDLRTAQPIVSSDPLRQNTRWPETGSILA